MNRTQPSQGADQMVDALSRFTALGTQQMLTAIQGSQPLVDAYFGMIRSMAVLPMSAMPALSSAVSSLGSAVPFTTPVASRCNCGCEIPETDCPPRCVCRMHWQGSRGERVKGSITLTNTAQKAQAFSMQATSFKGPDGDTGVTAALAPAFVTLNPNQSATIAVDLDVGDKFETGKSYDAEVTLTGQYEQCVQLCLTVRPSPSHHCEVRQGNIPTHIRAHRWYDHFQCEEPCFEPATPRTPNQTGEPNQPGHTHG